MDDDLAKDIAVFVSGAVGAAAIAPAFSIDTDATELYHITRVADANSIAQDGLQPGGLTPSEKEARDRVGVDEREALMERPKSARAEELLQEVLYDARGEADIDPTLPTHNNAVFFWGNESDADSALDSFSAATAIVGVDIDQVPATCNFAMAPTDTPDGIFQAYFDALGGRGRADERELFEDAIEWWESVQRLDIEETRRGFEIWTNCTIPPKALTFIKRGSDGSVIVRPTEKSQTRLQEFL